MIRSGQTRAHVATENGASRKSLLEISRKLSASIGAEFFQAIAKNLAEALTADCVIVAEFVGGHMERCRSVGAWSNRAPATFDYELAGSAAAQIALGKPCEYRAHLRSRFPTDALASEIGAEACIGVPLAADGAGVVGALMALYRRPMPSLRVPAKMLEMFAGRASAELKHRIEEERMRESEQRYRAFITRNADAMWRIEFEQPIPVTLTEQEQIEHIYKYGYVAECNDAAARMVGLNTGDQLIGARVSEIEKLDHAVRKAILATVRAGYNQANVETTRSDSNGHRSCLLRTDWGIVEDGQLQRVWGCTRDITDLRHAELALDASEQRMADLVESMRLLVVFIDLNGIIEFCNNYVFEVTEWPPDDLIGKDWLKVLVPPDERSRISSELERNTANQSAHFESTILTRSGSLQIEWDSTVLRNSDGHPAARALVGRDITQQKSLQEQILQAEKLAGIGRLAGGLAHDFNNLLTVILGYTSKLLDERSPADPAYSSLTQIQTAAARSADLAHRLLTFSRREIFRPQIVDLNSLIEESRSIVESLAGPNVRLIFNLAPGLGSVRIDPTQFHQVLMNLAGNGRDAMPGGGLMTIATCNFDVGDQEPHAAGIAAGEYVLLTVADTGTGMTEDVRKHLFEPFFTTKERGKGVGLGLAMVYGIVQQSSGYIRVDTVAERGTTFRIYLPRVHSENAPPARQSKARRTLPHGTESILLVEDRRSLGAVAAKALAGLGYTVLRADGPVQALEISRRKPKAIQLMLSPAVSRGMPAEVLLELVQEFQPNIKGVFVSSAGKGQSHSSATPPARADVLTAPLSRKELATKVREVLDRK
jgi:PAS domain S-box-containing protein